jgi:cytochrome c553
MIVVACVGASFAGALAAPPARPVAAPARPAAAVTPKLDSASIEFFERKIRPVLVQNCYQCHSATSEKLKASLYCDSREGMLKGGDSGAAIVPGKSAQSLLIKAIRADDKDLQMPPKTKLTAQQIADLTRWVDMGAPWPAAKKGAGPAVAGKPGWTAEERYAELRKSHWSWQPVKTVQPPSGSSGTGAAWATTDIDKFVLAKLEEQGLKPVGDADRVTLIRRVTFDLTGLPARPEEIIAFVADKAPDAYEKLVDRLLASPAFGEKWGRHWLDVARYGESTGSTRNYPYHHAWRYRDYVIDAFNTDKPYNQFIQEQVAGDLLPAKDAAQRNERLIATGFLAMGVKDLNEKNGDKFIMDNVDEQIDTMSRSILATTIACARCHDHKFDPIPTEDYYKIAGIFKSTEILSGVKSRKGGGGKEYKDENALIRLASVPAAGASVASPIPAQPAAKGPASRSEQIQTLTAKLEDLQGEMRKLRAELGIEAGGKENAKQLAKKNPAKFEAMLAKRKEAQELRAQLDALQGGQQVAAKKAAAAAPTPSLAEGVAIGVKEAGRAVDCRVNIRGDHDNLGAAVPRGFISLIKVPSVPAIKSSESGRLELAMWLSSAENSLTSRVMVNRIWRHLFGEGIVRTVDNFGSTGEDPSHPELLDYLAKQFTTRDGWSVKKTVRSIVLSRTYRLAPTFNDANYQVDPANTYFWRHAPKRLEAEQIRDSLLAIGNSLDLTRPLASAVAHLGDTEIREGRRGASFDNTGGTHRSVYMPVVRAMVAPMMDVFDFAEPTMVTGDRDVTTVATQALFLMNNPFTIEQSHRLADRLLADSSIGNDGVRIDHAYGWTLGRSATQGEKTRALGYIEAFVKEADRDDSKTRADAWTSFVQALVASAEFRYVN